MSLYLVPGDASFATQNTVIYILISMTVCGSHWVVPGDEYVSTNNRAIWIIPSMTLHMPLYVVLQDEFLATDITVIFDHVIMICCFMYFLKMDT